LGVILGLVKTDSAPGRLGRGFDVLGLQQLSPAAEAREQFSGETTAHLFHVRLLIYRKRLTIHDCGLGSLTSVRNAL
jgi:hypothetical protein